jgi:hypothetical protein
MVISDFTDTFHLHAVRISVRRQFMQEENNTLIPTTLEVVDAVRMKRLTSVNDSGSVDHNNDWKTMTMEEIECDFTADSFVPLALSVAEDRGTWPVLEELYDLLRDAVHDASHEPVDSRHERMLNDRVKMLDGAINELLNQLEDFIGRRILIRAWVTDADGSRVQIHGVETAGGKYLAHSLTLPAGQWSGVLRGGQLIEMKATVQQKPLWKRRGGKKGFYLARPSNVTVLSKVILCKRAASTSAGKKTS